MQRPQQHAEHDYPTTETLDISAHVIENKGFRPVVIPATSSTLGSPFVRAYASCLHPSIPHSEFMRFLDHLNRAIVVSPPLTVLGMVSGVVGLVPEPTAQLVGTVVDIAVEVASEGQSRLRTELLLRQANRDLFEPRGFKAAVARLDFVAKVASIPILDDKGKLVKEYKLLKPLEESNRFETESEAHQRRVQALEKWTAPLIIEDARCAPKQENLHWMSRLNVKASEWQRKEENKSLEKRRSKAYERLEKKTNEAREKFEKNDQEFEKEAKKIDGKQDWDEARREQEMGRLAKKKERYTTEYEEALVKAKKEIAASDKGEKDMKKMLFLVVMPLDSAEDLPEAV
jgi:hypothetical protein